MIREEVSRVARSGALMFVTYAVAKGWVPASIQSQVVDLVVLIASLGATLAWSKASDNSIVKKVVAGSKD